MTALLLALLLTPSLPTSQQGFLIHDDHGNTWILSPTGPTNQDLHIEHQPPPVSPITPPPVYWPPYYESPPPMVPKGWR